ncbi:MAG: hypothetical protein K6T39_01385 [Anoxybacillus ayderensis]|nr:hypothetical protein [Anoxybacillus ayderensis]
MNRPSRETMKRVYTFFLRTSVPRIIAKIERGELTWEEIRKKEVATNEKTPQRV